MIQRTTFFLLTAGTVTTSGFLTYFGLLNHYQGDRMGTYIFPVLIAVYIGSIAFFWYQYFTFSVLEKRTFLSRIKIGFICLLMIPMIWSTSTYFNIISLSGMAVTKEQIRRKLDTFKFEVISALQEDRQKVRRMQQEIRTLAAQSKSGADNEVDIDEDFSNAKGPMYASYNKIGKELAAYYANLDDFLDRLDSALEDDIKTSLTRFQDSISTAKHLEKRQDLSRQEADKLEINFLRFSNEIEKLKKESDNKTGSFHKTVGTALPSFAMPDGNLNGHEQDLKAPDNTLVIEYEEPDYQGRIDRFIEDTKSKISAFEKFLKLSISTIKYGSPTIMHEARDRYEELVSTSMMSLITDTPSLDAYAANLEGIIGTIDHEIQKSQALRYSSLSNQEKRRKQDFIPYLERTKEALIRIKSDLTGNEFTRQRDRDLRAVYEKIRMEPIDRAVWMPEYRVIPLIAIAVLIDFILYPLIAMQKTIVKSKRLEA